MGFCNLVLQIFYTSLGILDSLLVGLTDCGILTLSFVMGYPRLKKECLLHDNKLKLMVKF